jgi:hypothetical protein
MSSNSIEATQRAFCIEYQATYLACSGESKSGFASSTLGKLPINGLRHPPTGTTSGWFIWCGEHYSSAADFFEPVHTQHLYENHPELTKLLGLSSGYRFLLSSNYLDVWYDASLLEV